MRTRRCVLCGDAAGKRPSLCRHGASAFPSILPFGRVPQLPRALGSGRFGCRQGPSHGVAPGRHLIDRARLVRNGRQRRSLRACAGFQRHRGNGNGMRGARGQNQHDGQEPHWCRGPSSVRVAGRTLSSVASVLTERASTTSSLAPSAAVARSTSSSRRSTAERRAVVSGNPEIW